MRKLGLRQLAVVVAHALMLCGALMFAGMSLLPLDMEFPISRGKD